MTRSSRNGWPLIAAFGLTLTLLVGPMVAPARAADDAAKLAPDDAVLFAVVPDVSALVEKFKQTSVYGLYKDPAMQPFIGPAEKKVFESVEKAFEEGIGKLGVERPKEFPWPKGQAVFILRMVTETREVRDWGADMEGEKPKMRQVKEPAPAFVGLMDMGANADSAKDFIKKLNDADVEKEKVRRERQTIRGVDMDVLTPLSKDQDGKPVPSKEPPACFGFKDKTLIVGNNLDMVKDVLARMDGRGGGDLPSLADDPGLKAVRTAFGESSPAGALAYFNAKALMTFLKAIAQDANEREQILKTVGVLGLDNVSGVGLGVELAPNKQTDLRVRVQVAIRGQATGIPALIVPPSGPTKPGALATRGLAALMVANYDLGKLVDQIIRVVDASSGSNTEKGMEESMEETRGEGNDGEPPVNLKKEVFGQLGGPLSVLVQFTKPFTAGDSEQVLFALGVRDGKVLDKALGRIHDKLMAHGEKDARRELLNTKIYLMPNVLPMLMGGMPRGGGDLGFGMAVVGDQLVVGSIKWIEQCIRDRGEAARADREGKPAKGNAEAGLAADPMYQHASKFLPAQAAMFCYQNYQIGWEQVWAQLKELAKQPKGVMPPIPNRPAIPFDKLRASGLQASGDDEPGPGRPIRPSRSGSMGGPLSMVPGLGSLVEELDFAALPEFAAVRKYFGAIVGYLAGNDQGIYLEILMVKPPAGE